MTSRFITATFAIAAVTLSSTAHGQIRASERATVSQTVDGTTITIDYGRPLLRGRTELWGNPAVVPWGKKWTPGANWATNIHVTKDITISSRSMDIELKIPVETTVTAVHFELYKGKKARIDISSITIEPAEGEKIIWKP